MRQGFARVGKVKVVAILVLLPVLGTLGWVERGRIASRYYLFRLERATSRDQEVWTKKIAALEDTALPELMRELRSDNPAFCHKAQDCLIELQRKPDSAGLTTSLLDQDFRGFSRAGKCVALEVARALAATATTPEPIPSKALAGIVRRGMEDADAQVRGAALELAARRSSADQGEFARACLEATRAGLKDASAENRARAVETAGQPGSGLEGQVVEALRDPSPEVRCAALVAVAPAGNLVGTDDLLYWLHDPDARVRQTCEDVLRGPSRGLQPYQLKMGRMVTDPSPSQRVQVVLNFQEGADLDPGVWLRRLSHDPSPAVRAAMVRAVAEQSLSRMSDRIQQMCQDDPSPTVRQLARFYLASQKAK